MKIIGFNLSKILVEKKESISGKVQVNQNIDIKDIIEDSIPITKEKILQVKFVFVINFSENVGKLEFEGTVLIIPENNEFKEIIKSWKDKKIPDNIRANIFNFIMSKCNIKALSLEDDLNLPYHIPMPRINLPNEK